jgi:hypothetical protein
VSGRGRKGGTLVFVRTGDERSTADDAAGLGAEADMGAVGNIIRFFRVLNSASVIVPSALRSLSSLN